MRYVRKQEIVTVEKVTEAQTVMVRKRAVTGETPVLAEAGEWVVTDLLGNVTGIYSPRELETFYEPMVEAKVAMEDPEPVDPDD